MELWANPGSWVLSIMKKGMKLLLGILVSFGFISCKKASEVEDNPSVKDQIADAPLPETVTFSDHIAPILEKQCVECHNPDGIGPFSLLTYEDVSKRSRLVSEVTETRIMPPWKPDPSYSPALIGERRLTEKEIRLINTWNETGQLPGDGRQEIFWETDTGAWVLGTPDLILEVPDDYVLPAEGVDIYHNLVIPIPIQEKKYVRAIEFQPNAKLVIHHVQITLDSSSWARDKDQSEPGPGFGGMELGNVQNPSGYMIGWTPGQVPFESYEGAASELNTGTDMVLRLHMLPSGKPVKIQPRIGLYFTEEVPTRKTTILQLAGRAIDISAGDSDYVLEESMKLPVAVHVLGMYPHAHYLGKDLQLFARLPNGEIQGLVHIPDWDFNWQSDFHFVDPVRLPAGSELVMRYEYDNSAENIRNPFDPPRRVIQGWKSTDEMGEVAISLLLDDPADHQTLLEAGQYYLRDSMGASVYFYEKALDYLSVNKLYEAESALFESLKADPNFALATNNLGVVYQRQGKIEEAKEQYEKSLKLEPQNELFLLNLYELLEKHFSPIEAQTLLTEFLKHFPDHESIRLKLVDSYLIKNRVFSAVSILEDGLRLNPDLPSLNLRLGMIYSQVKEWDTAKKHLNKVVETSDDSDEIRNIKADALFALSLQAITQGELDAYMSFLQQTLEQKPDHKGARFFLAGGALNEGDVEGARKHLQVLVDSPEDRQIPPQDWVGGLSFPQGQLLVAEMFKQSGRRDRARALLEISLSQARQMEKLDWIGEIESSLNELE